eukprot:g14403.t1
MPIPRQTTCCRGVGDADGVCGDRDADGVSVIELVAVGAHCLTVSVHDEEDVLLADLVTEIDGDTLIEEVGVRVGVLLLDFEDD